MQSYCYQNLKVLHFSYAPTDHLTCHYMSLELVIHCVYSAGKEMCAELPNPFILHYLQQVSNECELANNNIIRKIGVRAASQ